MRHNALSAIAAATRCGGSGVSCRLQPGRAVAVDSCSPQLDTDKNSDILSEKQKLSFQFDRLRGKYKRYSKVFFSWSTAFGQLVVSGAINPPGSSSSPS